MSPQKQHRASGLEPCNSWGDAVGKARESVKTNRDKAEDIGWPERTRNRKLRVGRCFPKGRGCDQSDLHISLVEAHFNGWGWHWTGMATEASQEVAA